MKSKFGIYQVETRQTGIELAVVLDCDGASRRCGIIGRQNRGATSKFHLPTLDKKSKQEIEGRVESRACKCAKWIALAAQNSLQRRQVSSFSLLLQRTL